MPDPTAISPVFFGWARRALWVGGINLLADPIWIKLLDNTYLPDPKHQFMTAVTGEISGPGYTAGGLLLTGKSVTYLPVIDRVAFNATWPVWKAATITAYAYVLYKKVTADKDSVPICYVPFSLVPAGSVNLDFAINFDATYGIMNC